VNWFVNAVGDVPQRIRIPVTEVSVDTVHFIDTDRTAAFTVRPVGAVGAAAMVTVASRHVLETLSEQFSSDKVLVGDLMPNPLRMSPIDIV
jgi:hypothetical protein